MQLTENFRGLSLPQVLERAKELGISYERYSGSCSQCTVAALRDLLGFEDTIVKVATSSCGGQSGLSTGACGGVIGGTIVLDHYLGRPASMVSATETRPGSEEALACAMESARSLCRRFIGEYGSILCPQIHQRVFGRTFNLQDPVDWQAFIDAGAHSDVSKCMTVVGNAVKWTMEVLIEKGIVNLTE